MAAAEFATAAQGSTDCEALRILHLLEAEHKRLGKILREHHEKPNAEDPSHPSPSGAATSNAPTSSRQDPNRPPSPETSAHPPRLPRALRSNARDLSSSIASNLASARGIPSGRQKKPTPISPLVSNQHADGQIGQDEPRVKPVFRQNSATSDALLAMSKQSTSRPSWTPPAPQEQPAKSAAGPEAEEQVSDAPFQQFYSTFESLISKLSAPLAFAGLPLTTPASPKPPAPANASGALSLEMSDSKVE